MPEEVKIVVKQEAQGTALKDAEAQLETLKKAQSKATQTAKVAADEEVRAKGKATKIREEAVRFESGGFKAQAKELNSKANTIEKDAAATTKATAQAAMAATKAVDAGSLRVSKERDKIEKEITREKLKQSAEAKMQKKEEETDDKRRASRVQRVLGAVGSRVESLAGASGFGGVTSALGGAGGPAATVAAVAATIIASIFAREQERARSMSLISLDAGVSRSGDERHHARMMGPEGSAGASQQEAADARDEAKRLEDEKEALFLKAKPRWYKPFEFGLWANNKLFGDSMMTGEGEEAIVKNSSDQRNALARSKDADEAREKHYQEEVVPELAAQDKRLEGDRAGARQLEHLVMWRREYNRLWIEGGKRHPEEAMHGADNKVAEAMRNENMKWGHLVNARSGAGDIARAAALATGEIGPGKGAAGHDEIRALHMTVQRQHMEATHLRPLRDWTQR